VLIRTRLKALKNERAEVKLLLDAAARCEQIGPDAKAEALLDWLYRLQSEENDPELKALGIHRVRTHPGDVAAILD
jgi:hypothetical protein